MRVLIDRLLARGGLGAGEGCLRGGLWRCCG
jgi:hypothetical protein